MRLIGVVLAMLIAVAGSQLAFAEAPWLNPPSTTVVGTAGGGTIVSEAGDTTTSVVPGTTVPPVVCEWLYDMTVMKNGRYEEDGFVFLYIDALWFRFDPSTGEAWVNAMQECTQGGALVRRGSAWRPISPPDPETIARSMYEEVVREIPLPSPDMSPSGPGFVNLGMWLAVSPQDPVVAEADVGTVWARTTAELVSTSFDMGNDDVVSCNGIGDPIPESKLDSAEESPLCGYTYRDVSPDGAYPVTITSTWRIWWTSSTGAGGELGTMDRVTPLTYEVREIQTVGSP